MANILCLNFDGTIVLDDTMRQVIERFAEIERWESFRRRTGGARAREELSVEQENAAGLDLIEPSVTREEMEAYALEVARPREGLMELLDWTHCNDWLVAIVSLGFDFYVNPVLDRLGVDRAVRHIGRTQNAFRWRVQYLSPRGFEVQDGFKLSYAQSFRDTGDFVVYAGDGLSDVAPARLAGAVFARDALWERLQAEHPRIYPFETFEDVRRVLDGEAAGWLESWSSTTAAAD